MIEQSKQLAEQQNQLLEAVKDGKIGNTTNHTTNHTNTNCNNKFNLNVFLNETCKDAITMDDFINSFEVTREDFIHTGTVGFVEGISTVMTHRFRDMDMHTRPLHCTDLKRETIYIKNADKWEKDDADKTHMRKAVRGVAKKNMKELWRWFQDSKPAVEQIGTDECENYFQYHKAALGGYGKEEDLKFEEKIIKNVLKEVQINKNALTVS
jgi:SAM-dependent MidA family methyltransferase